MQCDKVDITRHEHERKKERQNGMVHIKNELVMEAKVKSESPKSKRMVQNIFCSCRCY